MTVVQWELYGGSDGGTSTVTRSLTQPTLQVDSSKTKREDLASPMQPCLHTALVLTCIASKVWKPHPQYHPVILPAVPSSHTKPAVPSSQTTPAVPSSHTTHGTIQSYHTRSTIQLNHTQLVHIIQPRRSQAYLRKLLSRLLQVLDRLLQTINAARALLTARTAGPLLLLPPNRLRLPRNAFRYPDTPSSLAVPFTAAMLH